MEKSMMTVLDDHLRSDWAVRFAGIGGAPVEDRLFGPLLAGWNSAGRSYHTTQHLGECLRLLDDWGSAVEARNEIGVALWFHDFVYDVEAADNEARSIDAAVAMLSACGIDGSVVGRIARLVEVTKHGSVAPVTASERLMVDIDLSILGADAARFEQSCRQVREEYSWVPLERYRRGRIDFLQSMLKRDRIYSSARAFEEREVTARRNLANEVSALLER